MSVLKKFMILFFLLVSSCSSIMNNDSTLIFILPISNWIDSIETLPDQKMIYVRINEFGLWEAGDDEITLEQHIAQNLQIRMNGEVITEDDFFFLDTFAPPVYMYDDNGNIIGSYGEKFHLYFKQATEKGLHSVSLEVKSTSGKQYFYFWLFYNRAG